MHQLKYKRNKDGTYPIQLFPGVDARLTKAALDVSWGQIPDPTIYNPTHHIYYSARGYGATGLAYDANNTVKAGPNFTFFDGPYKRFQDNMPQQGQINDDQFFWIEQMHFVVIPNITIAALAPVLAPSETPAAAASGWIGSTTKIPMSIVNSAELQTIYTNGLVNMSIGARTIIEDAWGLQNFHAGGGPVTAGAAASNSATTAVVGNAWCNNGFQSDREGWGCKPFAWLTKGRSVKLSVDFSTALPLTGAGVIIAFLEGTRITTGNV